ncbi:MAG: hypothetical protein CMH27_08275 [Micavibrio sp.]|nr:hypothetical protein [Micavibrio sp.]
MPRLGLGLSIGSIKTRLSKNSPLQYFGSSRLPLWLDASDESTITESSGNVSQWDDKSGNNNHATASGTEPTTGTVTINSLNALDFTTGQRMIVPYGAEFANSLGQHVFVVAEWDTLDTFSAVYSRYAGPGSREFNLLKLNNSAPANSFYCQFTKDGSAVTTIGKVTTIEVDTPYVLYGSVQDDAYVEVGVNNARADQRSLITGSVYDKPTTPPNITIGDQSSTGVSMLGKIAEIIVVSGDLSIAEKDWILNYLGNKWGIDVTLSAQDETTATAGQSNMLLWSTDNATYTDEGETAFTTEILTEKETQFFFNGAVNGSAVHEDAETGGNGFWIGNDNSDGGALTAFITNAAAYSGGIRGDISLYENILIVNGEADATAIASAIITKAQFKTALTQLVTRLNEECPNARLIFTPLGRRTGGNDSAVQQVRDAQLEVIAENSFCYLGWENHDQPLQDNIHRTPAGYTVEGTRAAEFVLTGTLRGPIITSATYSGSTVTATVALDSGAAISGSEVDTFRIEDDGSPVTISSLSIDGNEITFTLGSSIASGSTVELWSNYGQGSSVTPANVVKDANGYPIRTVSALSVSEG